MSMYQTSSFKEVHTATIWQLTSWWTHRQLLAINRCQTGTGDRDAVPFQLSFKLFNFLLGWNTQEHVSMNGRVPKWVCPLKSFTPTPASHEPTKAVLILFKGLEKRREWSLALWDKAIYSRWSANRPTNFLCGPSSSISASSGKRQANRSPNLLEVLPGGPCQSWSYKQGRKTDGSNYQEQTLQEFGRKTFQGVPTTLVGDLKPLSKEPGLDTSLYWLNWKQWCLWERSQDKKHARMKHCIPKLLYPPGNEKSPPPIKTVITLPIISRSIETSILCLASASRSGWSTWCFHQADCSNGPTPNETNPGRAWGINKTIPKLRVAVDSPNDGLTNGKIKRTWTKLRN